MHEQGHAAQTQARSTDMEMQHVLGHAAWTWICCMEMYMQHGHGHGLPCGMDMDVHAGCRYPYYMSQYMLCVNVHAACPCIWMSMSMLYVQVKAARTWTCSMDMYMQHGHGHAGINIGMQHKHGHVACTGTCWMNMETQHVLGIQHVLYWDIQHVLGHAAQTWTCSMDKYMLHPCFMSKSMPHVPVLAACPWSYCMPIFILHSLSILHVHIHAAQIQASSIDLDTQHRFGHAAWIWTCSMDTCFRIYS